MMTMTMEISFGTRRLLVVTISGNLAKYWPMEKIWLLSLNYIQVSLLTTQSGNAC